MYTIPPRSIHEPVISPPLSQQAAGFPAGGIAAYTHYITWPNNHSAPDDRRIAGQWPGSARQRKAAQGG
jgi:hypothetical protein